MKSTKNIIIFLSLFNYIISPVPTWTFNNLAIDLLTSGQDNYTVYSDTSKDVNLKRIITKSSGEISVQHEV